MPTPVRIGLICEDAAFQALLPPMVRSLVAQSATEAEIIHCHNLRGCRKRELVQLAKLGEQGHITVVGADAMAALHVEQMTFRKKARALGEFLAAEGIAASLAIAQPCSEAWLLSDLAAFKRGLETALETELRPARQRRIPSKEKEAKDMLGVVVNEIVQAPLARNGFEFADHIVSQMSLTDSSSDSLRTWSRDFSRELQRAANAP